VARSRPVSGSSRRESLPRQCLCEKSREPPTGTYPREPREDSYPRITPPENTDPLINRCLGMLVVGKGGLPPLLPETRFIKKGGGRPPFPTTSMLLKVGCFTPVFSTHPRLAALLTKTASHEDR